MQRDEIRQKLRAIVEPYVPEPERLAAVTEETHLMTDLGVNSANLVDVIIDAEVAFDIEIDDDDAERMLVVGDAISVIEARLAGA